MDLVFLFKCMMGLYVLDLSYYLVSADSSTCKYNLRHTNYQFKTGMPLHLRKTESLDDLKDLPEILSTHEGYFYILLIYLSY